MVYNEKVFREANFSLWYERLDRANSIALLLRLVPFVRLVGLNGSMVTGRMNQNSDIDFFIATTPNRLFTARLLTVLLVHLTGWRRYDYKVRGRVCLNRFATTDYLNVTPHNEYHARVFAKLAPLYAEQKTYEQYVTANSWMSDLYYPVKQYELITLRKSWTHFLKLVGEFLLGGKFGDWLERLVGKWQKRRIQNDPRTLASNGRVRVSDREICLHPLK